MNSNTIPVNIMKIVIQSFLNKIFCDNTQLSLPRTGGPNSRMYACVHLPRLRKRAGSREYVADHNVKFCCYHGVFYLVYFMNEFVFIMLSTKYVYFYILWTTVYTINHAYDVGNTESKTNSLDGGKAATTLRTFHSGSTLDSTANKKRNKKNIPIIIWWTERLYMVIGINEIKCNSGAECYVTKDRRYLSDHRTRGIYFYGTDFEPDDLPLPRNYRHEWILFHEESPMNNYILSHGAMIKLFNHTATFKQESDFPLTTQAIPSISYLLDRKPLDLPLKNLRRKNGLAPIIYVQSHCNVASDRDRYVKELMKYISIDAYGDCLQNRELPESMRDPVTSMESEPFLEFIASYKFHLAFENAMCDDYMTEKLTRAWRVGSIPIYKGSNRVKDWMPSASAVIFIDDFDSPQSLARYIAHIDDNDSEYNDHLQFKYNGIDNKKLSDTITSRTWGVNDNLKPDMLNDFQCFVCEKLVKRHTIETQHLSGTPTSKSAASSHLNCPQPYPSYGDIAMLPRNDSWMQHYWIEEYWIGLDKALAVQKMLEQNENDSSKFNKYLYSKP